MGNKTTELVKNPAGAPVCASSRVPCVACSVVCALRALFKMSQCAFYSGASAQKFLVSRAWSCVVRRIPSGKRSSIVTRSVPYLKGRTIARRSFPEAFRKVSATYDNVNSACREQQFIFIVKRDHCRAKVPLTQRAGSLKKRISSYFPGNF